MRFLVKFGFYPDTKESAENGHFFNFFSFGGLKTPKLTIFNTPVAANPGY